MANRYYVYVETYNDFFDNYDRRLLTPSECVALKEEKYDQFVVEEFIHSSLQRLHKLKFARDEAGNLILDEQTGDPLYQQTSTDLPFNMDGDNWKNWLKQGFNHSVGEAIQTIHRNWVYPLRRNKKELRWYIDTLEELETVLEIYEDCQIEWDKDHYNLIVRL